MQVYYDIDEEQICLFLSKSSVVRSWKRFLYSEKPMKVISITRSGMKDLFYIGRI